MRKRSPLKSVKPSKPTPTVAVRDLLPEQHAVWWTQNVLASPLWSKQVEILQAVAKHQYVAVASCHAGGKSYISARSALWYLYNHQPSIVITTAPTNRQVRGILWKEIKLAHLKSKVKLGGEVLTQEIRIEPDWFAFGFTAPERESDKFQGFHSENFLVIVDEASGVSEEIYEAIDGVLTGLEARILMISNPLLASGRFFDSFSDPDFHKITISAFDTPNFTLFGITEEDLESGDWQKKWNPKRAVPGLVTPPWVARQLKKYGKESPFYITRVLGRFPQHSEDTLLPLNDLMACQRAYERNDEYKGLPLEIAVDVARFGSDETVIIIRRGERAEFAWVGNKRDTMYVAGKVANLYHELNDEPSAIKVDVIGVGGGVVDRLMELGLPVVEMNGGASPLNDADQYLNARAEWYWNFRELVQFGEVQIPPDEVLISQLATIRFKYTSKGKIQIEDKDEIKKRLKSSPDRADALVMAFADTGAIYSPLLFGRAG